MKTPSKIAILHYATSPTVGGVEATIYHQARGLIRAGYRVKVITGSGEVFDDQVEVVEEALFGSQHPEILGLKRELDQGVVSEAFETMVQVIYHYLEDALADCEVCLVHNILTLHKNLPLTAALARFNANYPTRLIAWCHDLAWTNEQYTAELHAGYPWDLLREPWKGVQYVTVSESRQAEMMTLFQVSQPEIQVVPPGIDPAQFLHWSPMMIDLEDQLQLLSADGLLLLPARLTRRKNIELGLWVLHSIRKKTAQDFRLIVTGPPGPHNPNNPGYLDELMKIRESLELQHSVHFLYSYGIPDDTTIANLYQVCDALFFPSLQEGFGIPILEAGMVGLPIFCSDLPPLRATGLDYPHYFDPLHDSPAKIAALVVEKLQASPLYQLHRRVRQQYCWDSLIQKMLVPLLGGP